MDCVFRNTADFFPSIFLSAIWQPHGQFWVMIDGTVSPDVNHCVCINFNPKVTGNLNILMPLFVPHVCVLMIKFDTFLLPSGALSNEITMKIWCSDGAAIKAAVGVP